MRLAIVTSGGAPHQVSTGDALERGCAALGDSTVRLGSPGEFAALCRAGEKFDAVAIWGWRKGSLLRADGHRVLVMERAYIGDRYSWVSLGWNGLNGHAIWPVVNDMGTNNRFSRHFSQYLKPWKPIGSGHYALLMGQVPSDTAVRAIHFPAWAYEMTRHATSLGYVVRFRPHPQMPRCTVPGARTYEGLPLETELEGASFAITYNSNSGVDAVLAGVPTITTDKGAMAFPVTTHTLREPLVRPNRHEWTSKMAYRQWLPAEIADGSAWEVVRRVAIDGRA